MTDADNRHLSSHYRQRAIRQTILAHVAVALLTDTTATDPLTPGATPGDPVALRGIPVVGVHGGVGGAIPGTKPHGRRFPE